MPSRAVIESYEFKSAQMEADYNILINELRCLVCQNQNLAGSNADLAKDLRRQTYEMLTQGKTPDQVVQYMIDRYGDFVLYRPRLKKKYFTVMVWSFCAAACRAVAGDPKNAGVALILRRYPRR